MGKKKEICATKEKNLYTSSAAVAYVFGNKEKNKLKKKGKATKKTPKTPKGQKKERRQQKTPKKLQVRAQKSAKGQCRVQLYVYAILRIRRVWLQEIVRFLE